MTTDTTPAESSGLQRLKRWAALLRAENNSLGHSLETYAMEWEADLARAALATQAAQQPKDLGDALRPGLSAGAPIPIAAGNARCAFSCAAHVAEVHMNRYTIEWTNGPMPEGTALYVKERA